MSSLPLAGVKVVEVSVWHAGPGAGAILADLGADVIKVEGASGDPERLFGHMGNPQDVPDPAFPQWTRLFEMSNRGKRGVVLDITTAAGREALALLIAGSDVFLTNLRSSTLGKLGIDYDTVRGINESIVYASVNGYGLNGPLADAGGFDPLGQAMSGMMYMTNGPEPVLLDVVPLDQLTAITASHAILSALVGRDRTGEGEHVHVSLYGSALWLEYINLFSASVLPGGVRNYLPRQETPALKATYRCADGAWILACNNPEEKYWVPFCASVGLPELAEDPTLATREQRAARNTELLAAFDERFAAHDAAYWLEKLQRDGLLFAPIRTIEEVLDEEQALSNSYVVSLDHPILGNVKVPGYPVQFAHASDVGMREPAPRLAEHTRAVLSEFGMTDSDIQNLLDSAAAVQAPTP